PPITDPLREWQDFILIVSFTGKLGLHWLGIQPILLKPAGKDCGIAVRDPDTLGTGGPDGAQQSGPVRMIGENKAPINGPAAPGSANLHPAGGKGRREVSQLSHPRRALSRRRSEYESLTPICILRRPSYKNCCWKRNTTGAIGLGQVFDGTMSEDGSNGGFQPGQETLSLAERVSKEQTGFALLLIVLPPLVDCRERIALHGPAIDREAKGRFRDKCVATNWL